MAEERTTCLVNRCHVVHIGGLGGRGRVPCHKSCAACHLPNVVRLGNGIRGGPGVVEMSV